MLPTQGQMIDTMERIQLSMAHPCIVAEIVSPETSDCIQYQADAVGDILQIAQTVQTVDVTAALWRHVVRGCLVDVSNKELAIIENNQFTNLIE